MVRHIIWFAIALCCVATNASAWGRPRIEDEQVVGRADLIVVGRLKFETVKRVEHRRDSGGGRSCEHHATLVIESVIKGDSPARQIPVILHYGLTPVVSDGVVEIRDTGTSDGGLNTVIDDAAANCIWLLRRIKDRFGGGDGKTYGVEDPKDLQPLEVEEYLRCYLAPDP